MRKQNMFRKLLFTVPLFFITACGSDDSYESALASGTVTEVGANGRLTYLSTVTLSNSSSREIFANVLVRTNTRIHTVSVERLAPFETRVIDASYRRGTNEKWYCLLDNNPRGNSRRPSNVFGANIETSGIYYTNPRLRRNAIMNYTLSPTWLSGYRLGPNGPSGGRNMSFNNIRELNNFLRGPVGTDLATFSSDYVYRCVDVTRRVNSEIGIAAPVL